MYTAHVHVFTNLDLFCIDNASVIYRKIRYLIYGLRLFVLFDAYTKLRKATLSFVVSVRLYGCPSVHTEQLGSH